MASTMEEYLYLAIYYNSPQANAVELGPCYAFIIGPDIDDSLTNQDQKLTQFFPIDYAGQYREIRLTSFVSEDVRHSHYGFLRVRVKLAC